MDDIERRIRAARPVSGNRSMPLTDRAKRELAELLLSQGGDLDVPARQGSAPSPPRRRRRGVLMASLAVVIAVVVTVVTLARPTPVYAATPPMLQLTTIAESASELLTTMRQNVQAESAPAGLVTIDVQTWTLSAVEDAASQALPSVVVPQQYHITTDVDGVRTIEVRAGQPAVDARGVPTPDAQGGTVAGELLWSQSYAAGEYGYLFVGPVPDDVDAMDSYLRQGIGDQATPGAADYFEAISSLLLEQQPTGPQLAALLAFLARLPDVEVAGSVTDRLGREGVAFRAVRDSDPDYTEYLVVSPSTGQILAAETVYTGTTRTDIPSPAVTSYYAWNRS